MHRTGLHFSWPLTRFIAREVMVSFLMGTAIFLLIMLMFQAIRLSEFIVVHQVRMVDVGRLAMNLMLSFVPIAVPLAFLFSVLIGIARANSEGEILALQVSGISPLQIYYPLGLFSMLVTGICLYLSLYTVPQGNRSFELLVTKLGNERVMAALKPGVFMEFYGLVLFAEHMVPIKNEMKRVFIYDEREEKNPLAITAQAGILTSSPERGTMTLRLSSGNIYIDRKKPTAPQQRISFDVYDINLNLHRSGESWRDFSPPSYTYPQLRQRISETLHDPPHHRQLKVEAHRRFSLSFSCLVFAILGFVIGTLNYRAIRSTAIVICLIVAVIYWLSYVAANALALSGALPAWLGVWMPNILFLILPLLFQRRYMLR